MIREVYKNYSYAENQSDYLSFEELMEGITAGKLVLCAWVWSDPICYGLRSFYVQDFFSGQSWDYIKNQREFGPVSTQEMQDLYRMRVISTETPVKMCDQMYWHRYELVEQATSYCVSVEVPVVADSKITEGVQVEEGSRIDYSHMIDFTLFLVIFLISINVVKFNTELFSYFREHMVWCGAALISLGVYLLLQRSVMCVSELTVGMWWTRFYRAHLRKHYVALKKTIGIRR